MEIRLVNASDDRLAISRVYVRSWQYAYRGIIPQDYLDGLSDGSWISAPDRPGCFSLIVLDGGDIVGTSGCCKSRLADMDGWGEIVSIYLLPEYIGRGYGTPLLKAAEEELHKRGFEKIFLWVLEENARARRFYERNGFVPSGRYTESKIGGKMLREVQYIK